MRYGRSVSILIFITLVFSSISFVLSVNASENSELTSLSIEPRITKVPFLENTSLVILINVSVCNVQNLAKWSYSVRFDTSILEFFDDRTLHSGSGGWGYSHDYPGKIRIYREVIEPISGSATLSIHSFKVIGIGSTQIFIEDTYLEDASGSVISHTVSNNVTVEVYAELYNQLLAEYASLNSSYSTLLSDYAQLQEDYDSLNSSYNNLQVDYNSLSSRFDGLKSDYDSLRVRYDGLNSSYNSLNTAYTELKSKQEATMTELNNIRNLTYIFVTTTIVFIATTVYFAKRKPK